MKLSEKALLKINNQNVRLKLALGLGFTEQWIIQLLAKNKSNGTLTTAKALQIIKQETGLSEVQILENESQKQLDSKLS